MNYNTVVFLLLSKKRAVIMLVIISLVFAVMQSLVSVMPGYIVNSIVYLGSIKITYRLLLIYSIIIFLNIFIVYIKNILIINVEFFLREQMMKTMFLKLFKSSILEIRRYDSTYLTQRIINDVNFIAKFFVGCISTSFSFVIISFISLGVMARINYNFAIITLLSIPLYVYYLFFIRKKINEINLEQKESKDKYASTINSQISLMDVIRLNNLRSSVLDLIKRAFDCMHVTAIRAYKINFGVNFFENNVTLLIKIIFFSIGASLIIKGELSVGFFSITMSLYTILINNIKYFLAVYKEWLETKVSLIRLQEIYQMKEGIFGHEILGEIYSISVKGGEFNISHNKTLKYPDAYFIKGKIYCLKGKNGVGKTTLLNIITGLYCQDSLGILVNEKSLDTLDIDKMLDNISYIQQEPQFWDMTVKDNVSFYLQRKIGYNQFRLGLYNQGIDKIVGSNFLTYNLWNQRALELSLGQKRKLMLCIQLFKTSSVLLLDEPNAALDAECIGALKQWIKENRKRYITLIVSHDIEYLKVGAIEIVI